MEPQQFCDAPLIPKMAIQDIQPYSVVVSWQSRDHLGLTGFEIVYHATGDGLIAAPTDRDETRGRDNHREREPGMQMERDRDRDRDRDQDRHRQGVRQRERERDRDLDRDQDREFERDRDREHLSQFAATDEVSIRVSNDCSNKQQTDTGRAKFDKNAMINTRC